VNLSPAALPVLAACLSLLLSPALQAAESEPGALSAAQLASRLSEKENGTSYVRLRMESAGPRKSAIQVQIKSRASRGSAEVVYQILWPKERKGESVLLRRSSGRAASGVLFTPPDQTRQLDAAQMRDSLFGSDLSYEDVIENFFAWEQQAITGTETVDRVPCQILESKPGKSGHSTYGSVRSWIDPKRLVPLRVEKYSASGKLVRRIDTTRVMNDDEGKPVPSNLTVRSPGGDSVTELNGGKISHHITFTDADFTPEGIKQTAIPRGSPE
jgi:outer membrane lipoprotein-sorting protein